MPDLRLRFPAAVAAVWIAAAACAGLSRTPDERPPGTPPPNLLLVIADDLGIEQLASFGLGDRPADTPHIDALAAAGVQFDRVWAMPLDPEAAAARIRLDGVLDSHSEP